ncbi:MAG: THUMP domain-containing protein [Microscillaceae bacterium]|jgi:putative N6-adenine-specific DNA methylase|nr:THUMP domain-containing protein [Microscillaceae bacterium]
MAQEKFKMIAQTMFGLEDILIKELHDLGVQNPEKYNRAIGFEGDWALLYKANLCLRTALRILLPIHSFQLKSERDLYNEIKKMDWEEYLGVDDTLAIDCSLNSPLFTHSQYLEQKTKDAIVDQFRDKYGRRPSVDLHNPTLKINLYIHQDTCTVSLDSSGDSLHKRGYRDKTNLAPINEVLAAGMILLTAWDTQSNFIDPMCGSGTILIEAALIANRIPPGSYRKNFGFENWKNFDPDLWEEVYDEAMNGIIDSSALIYGGEISKNVIRKTIVNINEANLKNKIQVNHCAFADLPAPEGKGILVINPPYGERMDKDEDINALYKSIGDTLKQKWAGYEAWLITSNLDAAKHIRLEPKPKIKLFNGSLECRFMRYELYSGTRRTDKLK